MKRLTLILLLIVITIVPATAKWRHSYSYSYSYHPTASTRADQIIRRDDIQEAGCVRLSDILQLINDWDLLTQDGYTWEMSASGMGTMLGSDILILVDGNPVDLQFNSRSSINQLPMPISRIEKVHVYNRPVVLAGCFAPQGALEFKTRSPLDGITYRGMNMHGNETGEPGPWKYVNEKQTPNVDRIGVDWSYGGSLAYKGNYVSADYVDNNHYETDPAILPAIRLANGSIDKKIEVEGMSGQAEFQVGPLRITGVGYHQRQDRLPFFYRWDTANMTNNHFNNVSSTADLYLTNHLSLIIRGNRTEIDSHPSTVSLGDTYKIRRESYNGALRGLFRAFSAEAGHRTEIEAFEYIFGYGESQFSKRNSYLNGRLDLHDFILETFTVYSVDGWENSGVSFGTDMWYRINSRWRIGMNASHVKALFNPLDQFHDIPTSMNDEYVELAGDNASKYDRAAGSVQVTLPYHIRVEATASLQHDEELHDPRYLYYSTRTWFDENPDPWDTRRLLWADSSLAEGTTGFLSLVMKQRLSSHWSYRLSSHWKRVLDGDESYRLLRDEIADHRFYGSVLYDAPGNFTARLSGLYRHGISTVTLYGIPRTMQPSVRTSDLVRFDLTVTKGFWHNHIRASAVFLNLLNREQRWSPYGGGIYDLTFFFKLEVILPSSHFF